MIMLIKKRQVVLVLLVVMLGVAGYLNTFYKNSNGYDADNVLTSAQADNEAEDAAKNFGEAMFVDSKIDEKQSVDENENKETNEQAEEGKPETGENEKTTSSKKGNEYFAKARLSREQARSESIELLQSIADSKASNDTTKQQALNDISVIANAIEDENRIENLIMAKGFSDCVVYISDGRVNVMAPGKMEKAQAAKIMDIVLSEVSVPSDKVKIIEIK